MPKEKVRCNSCGVEYEDEESVKMTKDWIGPGYAPCPNIPCEGEFELIKEGNDGK